MKRLSILIFLILFFLLPPSTYAIKTIGYPTAGVTQSGSLANYAICDTHSSARYTASAGDVITDLYLYCTTAGIPATVDMAVYVFSGGVPTTKVGSSTTFTIPTRYGPDWLHMSVNIPLTAGTTYILATGNGTPFIPAGFWDDPGANGILANAESAPLPSIWSDGTAYQQLWSFYGVINSSTGGFIFDAP